MLRVREKQVLRREVLSMIDLTLIIRLMEQTFSPIDLLFYGIAGYEGWQFSLRQISEEEVIRQAGAGS